MQLVEFGIYEQAERRWSSTVTFKLSSPLLSLPMGQCFPFILPVTCLYRLYDISYQIATGSGDDTVRIWDMRSLKALYTIPAHLSNVADIRFFRSDSLSFTPSATPQPSKDVDMADPDVSNDTETKPSATNGLTLEQQEQEFKYRSGLYFASAGYDGLVKLWSADDWQLLRTLPTDGGKVMSVDLSNDGKLLASGTYNRNFQMFAPEDLPI